MTKSVIKAVASIALIATLTGCSAENPFYNEGEGTIYLSTKLSGDVKTTTRGELEELAQSSDIWIANDKGVVRKYEGINEIPPSGIKLVAGNYKAMIWAGDSLPASWNQRFFKGVSDFQVSSGDKKTVQVIGKIANSAVSVNFDESLANVMSDFSFIIGHSQGKLTFDSNTEVNKKGYFMMNSRDKDLTYVLKGTLKNGTQYEKNGVISNCQPTTLYSLNISCSENNSEIGGAYFTIEIEESSLDSENENIIIETAPKISGINFDITNIQRATKGDMGAKSIWIAATNKIESLKLKCDYFSSKFVEFQGNNSFDFFKMEDESLKQKIINSGITYVYNENPQEEQEKYLPTIKLTFASKFTDELPDGEYPIEITVTDVTGKTSMANLVLLISDLNVLTNEIENLGDVWAHRATVTVTVQKDGVENIEIQYRKKNADNWENSVIPTVIFPTNLSRASKYPVDTILTAELNNLAGGTTYEYCAVADGVESNIVEFTTEIEQQLPNSSFEDWQTNSSPYLIYKNGDDKFWDSGNHGSATLRKNVTVPTSEIKHSGEKAISLESQFVGLFGQGKFASGNVFAGEYLDTDVTDGVIGFGRPFSSRPKQLKVWARYVPVNIDRMGDEVPDEYVKGQPDKGQLYIALMDDNLETYNGKKYPVIAKTKKEVRRLFKPYEDKDKQHVIAYGEHIFDENSPATNPSDGQLVQITIDLDYASFNKNIRPSYIIITAAASKGGDYFTGGDGTKLVLDDIELVY